VGMLRLGSIDLQEPFAYSSGDVEIGFRIVLQEETHCVRLSKWGC
jgi:hypothetical protein